MKLYGFAWPGAVLSLFFIFPALIIGLVIIVIYFIFFNESDSRLSADKKSSPRDIIFTPQTREQKAAFICLEGGRMNRDLGNFKEAIYWYDKFLTHNNIPNAVRETVMKNIIFCEQQKDLPSSITYYIPSELEIKIPSATYWLCCTHITDTYQCFIKIEVPNKIEFDVTTFKGRYKAEMYIAKIAKIRYKSRIEDIHITHNAPSPSECSRIYYVDGKTAFPT